MSLPFQRHRLTPLAGQSSEVRVSGGAWCFELERGACPGARLAFEDPKRSTDNLVSVPFDAPGASVPANGVERVWIQWPAVVDATQALEFTAWTAHALYRRLSGDWTYRAPIAFLLDSFDLINPGATFSLPSTLVWPSGFYSNILAEEWTIGDLTRLARGARLVADFAIDDPAAAISYSVMLMAVAPGGSNVRMIDGRRAIGVPARPVGVAFVNFDRPAPLGQFRFDFDVSAAADVVGWVYLLLGP